MLVRLLLAPLRSVLTEWTHPGSAPEVGLGMAIGFAAGIVPPENLTAVAVAMLLVAMRTNISAGAVAMPLGSLLGWALEGPLHGLGRLILTQETLRPILTAVFSVPGMTITRLDNTVVVGSLVVGVAAIPPIWWTVTLIWGRLGRMLGPRAARRAPGPPRTGRG